MNFFKCLICKIVNTIRGIKYDVEIPQPIELSGTITCDGATAAVDFPQPLEISGTINTENKYAKELAEQLATTSSYTELVLSNGEQFQKVADLKISGELAFFSSQGQQIIVPVCNIEYVVQ